MPPKTTQKRAAALQDVAQPPSKRPKPNKPTKKVVTVLVSVENEASQAMQQGSSQERTSVDEPADDPADEPAKKPAKETETAEQELARILKKCNASIYGFYEPIPLIQNIDGRRAHIFLCSANGCGYKCRRYTDTKDHNSTGNLRKHIRKCWGIEALALAEKCGDSTAVCKDIVAAIKKSGSITAYLLVVDGKEMFSNRQRTPSETRAELVRWVSINFRPFAIVEDLSFRSLMKTGRPEYYLPSPKTVSRDVKTIFVKTRSRVAKLLREYKGTLSFATDAWTSPNHRAFVGTTVHFVVKGTPACMILDLIEVPESHTGDELALAFTKTMEEFGIEHKILSITCDNASVNDRMVGNLEILLPRFAGRASHMRCFSHILNLVAKGVIQLFDVPKKGFADDSNEQEALLASIVDGLEDALDLEDDVDDDTVSEEDVRKEASILSLSE